MRIDSHQHFWYYDPVREGWISDQMKKIRKDFLPKDLEPVLKQHHIDACVLVQANDSEAETNRLLEFAHQTHFVKAVVGWVDLTRPSVEQRLGFYTQNPVFKGVRHALQAESTEFILSEPFAHGLSELTKLNLTYDLLVLGHQLKATAELVRRNPDQAFVLDHMAKPSISKGVSSTWEEGIRTLARHRNVQCKVSGFLVETEGLQWEPDDFVPFLEVVWDAFGEDRLMYGSDWPVCLGAGSYGDTLQIVEAFFKKKGSAVLEKVMGKNAQDFYRI